MNRRETHPLPRHFAEGDTLVIWKLDRLGRVAVLKNVYGPGRQQDYGCKRDERLNHH